MKRKSLCGRPAVAYLIMSAIREGETIKSFHPRCDGHLTAGYPRRAIRIGDVRCSAIYPRHVERNATIREMASRGVPLKEIAARFGITEVRVWQIIDEAT